MMQAKSFLVAAALALGAAGASATVYNISATDLNHTFLNTGPSPFTTQGNGFTLANGGPGSLTYNITAVDVTDGGMFTAANRFSSANLPGTGWEWNYWVQIDASTPYQVGFGGGIGDPSAVPPLPWNGFGGGVASSPGTYASTDGAAFTQAPAMHSFNLSAGQSAKVYWLDDNWGDNAGGISVNVSVVPEPEAYALALAALGVLGVASRRKTVLK